jgi:hypothetical protein
MPIEARNRPLPDWFTRIRTRQTVLPRFQRFEAWGHASVIQLFNTILRDLPVGAVLVLEVGNEEPFMASSSKPGGKDAAACRHFHSDDAHLPLHRKRNQLRREAVPVMICASTQLWYSLVRAEHFFIPYRDTENVAEEVDH